MLETFKDRKRSFVYTHFPQEGAHTDPWSAHVHTHTSTYTHRQYLRSVSWITWVSILNTDSSSSSLQERWRQEG